MNETTEEQSVVPVISPQRQAQKDAVARLNLVKAYLRDGTLIQGEDYGIIPGTGSTSKPTLLKPGAQKLCALFDMAVEIKDRHRVINDTLIAYEITVVLRNKLSGTSEGEGVGMCNSNERRYKSQDKYNVANTLLKMAEKRALVDATLNALGISSLFTQDLEDLQANDEPEQLRAVPQPQQPPQAQPEPLRQPAMATEDDLRIYEQMRIAAQNMGLTPTGALVLGTATKKVFEQRRAMLDEMIRAQDNADVESAQNEAVAA